MRSGMSRATFRALSPIEPVEPRMTTRLRELMRQVIGDGGLGCRFAVWKMISGCGLSPALKSRLHRVKVSALRCSIRPGSRSGKLSHCADLGDRDRCRSTRAGLRAADILVAVGDAAIGPHVDLDVGRLGVAHVLERDVAGEAARRGRVVLDR